MNSTLVTVAVVLAITVAISLAAGVIMRVAHIDGAPGTLMAASGAAATQAEAMNGGADTRR